MSPLAFLNRTSFGGLRTKLFSGSLLCFAGGLVAMLCNEDEIDENWQMAILGCAGAFLVTIALMVYRIQGVWSKILTEISTQHTDYTIEHEHFFVDPLAPDFAVSKIPINSLLPHHDGPAQGSNNSAGRSGPHPSLAPGFAVSRLGPGLLHRPESLRVQRKAPLKRP